MSTVLTAAQRVRAAFEKRRIDTIAVYHFGFSSRVGSALLGRECYSGGGSISGAKPRRCGRGRIRTPISWNGRVVRQRDGCPGALRDGPCHSHGWVWAQRSEPGEVIAEARDNAEAALELGGILCGVSNQVPPLVPIENVMAMLETLEDYR